MPVGVSVDQAAQHWKQIGAPLDLIEDHQPAQWFQGQLWFGQPGQIGGSFEVEVCSLAVPFLRNTVCDRGLTDLAGPEQRHRRVGLQTLGDLSLMSRSRQHPVHHT